MLNNVYRIFKDKIDLERCNKVIEKFSRKNNLKSVDMDDVIDIEKHLYELRNKLLTNQAKREDLILNYSNLIQAEKEEYLKNEMVLFTHNNPNNTNNTNN